MGIPFRKMQRGSARINAAARCVSHARACAGDIPRLSKNPSTCIFTTCVRKKSARPWKHPSMLSPANVLSRKDASV
eukprot:2085173-Rhodomonas_salina.1